MNTIEDATLFSISYNEDGTCLHIEIGIKWSVENPDHVLTCRNVIMSSIQNGFSDGDGLPCYIAIITTKLIHSDDVLNKLRGIGFSLDCSEDHVFGESYYIRVESGDYLAEIICREVVLEKKHGNVRKKRGNVR